LYLELTGSVSTPTVLCHIAIHWDHPERTPGICQAS